MLIPELADNLPDPLERGEKMEVHGDKGGRNSPVVE